jgi:protein-disulfide isomerase
VSPELTSAGVPEIGADDHVRGQGPEAILYMDLACPACALTWSRVRELPLRLCLRHFPLASKRPRAPPRPGAAAPPALQGDEAFWGMVEAIYADHGRLDDPHLWQRAEALGLDLEAFERDRRSAAVSERVRGDFETGIRAGVVGTPTAFVAGSRVTEELERELAALI